MQKNSIPADSDVENAGIHQLMTEGSDYAVAMAAAQGFDLDYSVSSIAVVEEMMGSLCKKRPKGVMGLVVGPSRKQIRLMSLRFGAYIGEVLRRQVGGEWILSGMENGMSREPTLQLRGAEQCWPAVKVEKRIMNGQSENLIDYVNILLNIR